MDQVSGDSGMQEDQQHVSWVKDHSGLAWQELGQAFGVSSRAVHLWAHGGRMTETAARRLQALQERIVEIEATLAEVTPQAVREQLVSQDGLIVQMRIENMAPPVFAVEELVGALHDEPHTVEVEEL